MRKILFTLCLLLSVFCVNSQNKVSLLPSNMKQYIGAEREDFEKIFGAPTYTDTIGNTAYEVYTIENPYEQSITEVRCYYVDDKVTSVKFPSCKYVGYWLSFSYFKGFTEKNNYRAKKDALGNYQRIHLFHNGFNAVISDIKNGCGLITYFRK